MNETLFVDLPVRTTALYYIGTKENWEKSFNLK